MEPLVISQVDIDADSDGDNNVVVDTQYPGPGVHVELFEAGTLKPVAHAGSWEAVKVMG